MQGVAGLPPAPADALAGWANWQRDLSTHGCSEALVQVVALPADTCLVLGGCHQLLYVDGQLVGDPMEKA